MLHSATPEAAGRRLSIYQIAQRFEPLSVDERVSEAWALLVPVVTQGTDYSAMPGVDVIQL